MKLLILLLLSTSAFSSDIHQIGGKLINKLKTKSIYLHCDGFDTSGECHKALFVLDVKGEKTLLNDTLVLEMGSGDEFYDRWYIFNMLKTTASTSRPPFPYTWYIMNMQTCSKQFMKAFKLMDMKGKAALGMTQSTSNKNFEEMIKAIKNY